MGLPKKIGEHSSRIHSISNKGPYNFHSMDFQIFSSIARCHHNNFCQNRSCGRTQLLIDLYSCDIFEISYNYTSKRACSRRIAMLFQQFVNRMCSRCLLPACWQGEQTCHNLHVIPTTFYRPEIQQFVNNLWVEIL
jgi:hypothetical protein